MGQELGSVLSSGIWDVTSSSALNYPLRQIQYVQRTGTSLGCLPCSKGVDIDILGYSYVHKYRTSRYRVVDIPEVQLMSTIIVALKLTSSFDSMERNPKSDFEAASLVINWHAWKKSIEDHKPPPESLYDGKEIHVVEGDIFNMSKNQMDQYMDWYEKMWVGDETESKRKFPVLCLLQYS